MALDAPAYIPTPRAITPPRAEANAPDAAIQRTAKEFESMVIGELIGPMFESLDTEGLGGGGAGERMFRPMLVREYAQRLTAAGGIGLADAVAREMVMLQARASGVSNANPR